MGAGIRERLKQMKHLRISSTYICLNRAALTHSFQLGSSHSWNRQGIAQANWNLCYLVGAVLFSLFTGVSATVFLLRGSYSGWVGVSRSLQGGWPFSGVHRRGNASSGFWESDALTSATCSTLQSELCCCSCSSCPDRSSACHAQVQFPWVFIKRTKHWKP